METPRWLEGEVTIEPILTIQNRAGVAHVACVGEIDLCSARRLRDAIDEALEASPTSIVFDGRGITLLTTAGIRALFHLYEECDKRGVSVDLQLSPQARRVLDLVGLWWLGIVPDGLKDPVALEQAIRTYGELRARDETLLR